MKSRGIHAQQPTGLLAGSTVFLSGVAQAQTPAPAFSAPQAAQASPSVYQSAFEGYQAYTDEKIVNWKEASDNAGRIGGWRGSAKEACESQTPDGAASRQGLEQTL